MKESARLKEIISRMAPGAITLHGFLGNDKRSLEQIIAADEAELARRGLSRESVASRMAELRDAGLSGLGEPVDVPPNFEVRVDSERGKLPCPFGDQGGIRKTVVFVRNKRLGRGVTYTELGIHMLKAHGFLEGRGSPFRLEPAELAEILELGDQS